MIKIENEAITTRNDDQALSKIDGNSSRIIIKYTLYFDGQYLTFHSHLITTLTVINYGC